MDNITKTLVGTPLKTVYYSWPSLSVIETTEAPRVNLDTGQRIGVALLICITLVLIGVSIVQYNSSIKNFGTRKDFSGSAPALDPAAQAKNQQDALKKIDTDGDGLSDYDEIYVFHSSPYIRDTDSDGIPDGEEVRRGTSPICPEGKDCSIDQVVAAGQTASASSSVQAVLPLQTSEQAINPNNSAKIVAPTIPAAGVSPDISKMTPAQIRQLLIDNGIPKEKLSALTDSELVQLMQEVQKEANGSQAGAATSTP